MNGCLPLVLTIRNFNIPREPLRLPCYALGDKLSPQTNARPGSFCPLPLPRLLLGVLGGRMWRICTMENGEVAFLLAVDLGELEAEMGRVRNAFLAALPAALLLIALGSWLLSRRALRSVEDLAHVAEQVSASHLNRRIPTEGVETEFRRLVIVFNEMLDRLERSFYQATRFSADAAHELRTPLTILQGELEEALQSASSEAEQRVLSDLLGEVQRLKDIIRKLLLLSLADAGRLQLTRERVNLSELVEGLREDIEVLAPHLSVTAEIAPEVWLTADVDLLRQALRNLSTNAVKYNREGGAVILRLREQEGRAEFSVSNTGPGIAPTDRPHVFDRFYRGDPSRGRTDGVGLGLSLAREIARAHGGELTLEDSYEDLTTFTLTLPVESPPSV
ncbi:MAG: sensor histidine kinase [Candidatus Zipacnadales bacterium]